MRPEDPVKGNMSTELDGIIDMYDGSIDLYGGHDAEEADDLAFTHHDHGVLDVPCEPPSIPPHREWSLYASKCVSVSDVAFQW